MSLFMYEVLFMLISFYWQFCVCEYSPQFLYFMTLVPFYILLCYLLHCAVISPMLWFSAVKDSSEE